MRQNVNWTVNIDKNQPFWKFSMFLRKYVPLFVHEEGTRHISQSWCSNSFWWLSISSPYFPGTVHSVLKCISRWRCSSCQNLKEIAPSSSGLIQLWIKLSLVKQDCRLLSYFPSLHMWEIVGSSFLGSRLEVAGKRRNPAYQKQCSFFCSFGQKMPK